MEILESVLLCDTQVGRSPGSWVDHFSPTDSNQILFRISSKLSDAHNAIEAATGIRAKFNRNRQESFSGKDLDKIQQELLDHKDRLFDIVRIESGRTINDFSVEFDSTIAYIQSLRDHEDFYGRYSSRGICVVVGSSVWPIFYSIQFTLANFVVGNPVILKPSEKTTKIALEIARILQGSTVSPISIQVVVGDKEVGRRLISHPKVDIVIFQGSYEVGMRIRQDVLHIPSREVLLYLGSKNVTVLNRGISSQLVDTVLEDAFLGAGQNCLSSPLLFIHDEYFDGVVEELLEGVDRLTKNIAKTKDALGPLQDQGSVDRYLKYSSVIEREGAEMIFKGKRLAEQSCFVTPTVATFRDLNFEKIREMVVFHQEVLGPSLTIIKFDDMVEIARGFEALSYGLGCSIWSEKISVDFSDLAERHFGRVVRNGSLVRPDVWISPLARKKSGNHGRLGQRLLEQISR